MSLNVVQSSPDAHTGGLALATGPPSLGDSAVHYAYNRYYDYGHPIHYEVHYDYAHPQPALVDHFGVIHPVHGHTEVKSNMKTSPVYILLYPRRKSGTI